MSLTVLNVAFPMAPVGPDSVGGAEQVVTHLDTSLCEAGHRSLVIAAKGSRTKGTLLETPFWSEPSHERTRAQAAQTHRTVIAEALSSYSIDLVHLHGIDFLNYLPPAGPPVLITLHLPLSWYPPNVFELTRPRTFLHCVSASQRRGCLASGRLLPDIENGVPEDLLTSRHGKRSFTMCLGRICPEKGFHHALDAARRANVPLLLGGEVFAYEAHQKYFAEEIAPRLDDRRRFIGPVGWTRKRRLLGGARCLLVPSLVPETSSLVAMEALACGTPVIAFAVGALTDLIEPGRTGFLVNNAQEMAAAIPLAASIRAEDCRRRAGERFSLRSMIAQYLSVYRDLVKQERVN